MAGISAHGGIVPQSRRITTSTGSLSGGGTLANDLTLTLANDAESPGASKMYGTNGSGVKGWQSQPSGAGVPADTVTAETSLGGASSSAGVATTYSRGDHTHGTPADPVPAHAALTTGVHGAGASTLATVADIATHAGAADPHTGYQKESEKGAASGYASLDGSTLVPVAQLGTGTPDGTKYLRDDRTWQTPAGGSSAPAWHSTLYGAFGNCDPNALLRLISDNPVNATPTNISVSIGRLAYFRPPANITVNTIRFYGVGATTGVYHVAIYPGVAGGSRLTADLSPNTASHAWGTAATGLGLSLTAGTLYCVVVGVDTTGTTAGMLCIGGTTGRIGVLPASWPGSLDIDAASPIVEPWAFAQVALTTGAMPATLPAIAARAAWTGGMPAIFLDNA